MIWFSNFKNSNCIVVSRIIELADISDRDLYVLSVSSISSDNPDVGIIDNGSGIYSLTYNKFNNAQSVDITFSFENTGLSNITNAYLYAFTANSGAVSDNQEGAVSQFQGGYLKPLYTDIISSVNGDIDDVTLTINNSFKNLYFSFFLYTGTSVKSRDVINTIVNSVPMDINVYLNNSLVNDPVVFLRLPANVLNFIQSDYMPLISVPAFKDMHYFAYIINDIESVYQQDVFNSPGDEWNNDNIYGGKSANIALGAGVYNLSVICNNHKAKSLESKKDFIIRVNNVFGSGNCVLGSINPETLNFKLMVL